MALPGRKRKKNGPSDAELVDLLKRRLESSRRHMKPIMERVERARLVAAGTSNPSYGEPRDPDDPHDWRSRMFPPIMREKWEVKCAELSNDKPRIDFTAHDIEYEDNAEVAENAVAYHYDRDRFQRTFRMAMRAATRDGGAVIKTTWDKRTGIAFDEAGMPILDDNGDFVSEVKFSGVRNALCRLEDIFPDPTATTFRSAKWVIHRFYATTEELRAQGKFYTNLDKLPEVGGGGDGQDTRRDGETQEAFDARRKGVHTCYEMWTPYSRVTVANCDVVIRRDDRLTTKTMPGETPEVPFTMIRTIDDEDCIVGTSMMTLGDDLQEGWWSLFNDLFDAVKLSTNPPMIADTEEDPNAAKQVIYPNCVLHARNGQQTLKVMQDVAQLAKYDIQGLLDMTLGLMDRVTGITAALAGVSDANTATEASINVRQGKGRVGAEMEVSDECWAKVAQKTYCLIQQYESDEVIARLSNGRDVRYAPEQLVDMMITPRSASSERALKDLERQDRTQLWEIAKETIIDPASQMPSVDHTKLFADLIEAYGGNRATVRPPMPPPSVLPGGGDEPVIGEGGEMIDYSTIESLPDPEGGVQPHPAQVGAG